MLTCIWWMVVVDVVGSVDSSPSVGTESAPPVVMPSSLGGRGRLRSRVAEKVKLWYREAKALASSDFEAALLKSTRPDHDAPKMKHVESIVGVPSSWVDPAAGGLGG